MDCFLTLKKSFFVSEAPWPHLIYELAPHLGVVEMEGHKVGSQKCPFRSLSSHGTLATSSSSKLHSVVSFLWPVFPRASNVGFQPLKKWGYVFFVFGPLTTPFTGAGPLQALTHKYVNKWNKGMWEQRNKVTPPAGSSMAEPSLELAALSQHTGRAVDRTLSFHCHCCPLTARRNSSQSPSDRKAVIKPESPCARGEMMHSRCTV